MRTLGEPLTVAERQAVIAAARALLGKPWRHHAYGPRHYDCRGILWAVLAVVRPLPAPPADYGRLPHNRTLRAHLVAWLGEPVTRDPIPGDIVSLKWTGEENHVALVVDHPDRGIGFLHCYSRAAGAGGGRVIEHGADARELRRIVEVFSP